MWTSLNSLATDGIYSFCSLKSSCFFFPLTPPHLCVGLSNKEKEPGRCTKTLSHASLGDLQGLPMNVAPLSTTAEGKGDQGQLGETWAVGTAGRQGPPPWWQLSPQSASGAGQGCEVAKQ